MIAIKPEVATGNIIRLCEQEQIVQFLHGNGHLFAGKRVLDYGCGKEGTCRTPQPYRELVERSGGQYTGFDQGDPLPDGQFDVMLFTQVIQYLQFNWDIIFHTVWGFKDLVLVYPSAWPASEQNDYRRITKAGMEDQARIWGWVPVVHEELVVLDIPGFRLPLVYGMVAKRVEGKG